MENHQHFLSVAQVYNFDKYLNILTLLLVSKTFFLVRFEVLTAVTIKNAVFWDIKTQFVPHRRHITSAL
jgi:hypothetical protein